MSTDLWATVLLIVLTAPAATAFPIAYAWISRGVWWRVWAGRAIMTSSVAVALLIDLALAYQLLGEDYEFRWLARLLVFSAIAAGAWMNLGALLYEHGKQRRGHRAKP